MLLLVLYNLVLLLALYDLIVLLVLYNLTLLLGPTKHQPRTNP